ASAEAIDLDELRRATNLVGYPIVGLVAQLAKQCGEAGRYLHWARPRKTSWTPPSSCSSRRRWRWSMPILPRWRPRWRHWPQGIAGRVTAAARPCNPRWRSPSATRPGFGSARSCAPRRRLAEWGRGVLVGKFAGAAGTLASFGEKGLAVNDHLMANSGSAPRR